MQTVCSDIANSNIELRAMSKIASPSGLARRATTGGRTRVFFSRRNQGNHLATTYGRFFRSNGRRATVHERAATAINSEFE